MNLNQLAGGTAAYLARELALETCKTDTLRFGLEIIFGALIKGITLFSLAYLLAILPEVVFAVAAGSLFRLLSSGAHCTGYRRCLVLGLFIYLAAGVLGLYLEHYISTDSLIYLLLAGHLLSSLCVIAWAPGEAPFKKNTKMSERILFKALSLAYLNLWLGTSILVSSYYTPSLALAGFIAVLAQTISFTPPGYKAIHQIDNLLIKVLKERRCPDNDAHR